jgi:hypothetical protein
VLVDDSEILFCVACFVVAREQLSEHGEGSRQGTFFPTLFLVRTACSTLSVSLLSPV